MANEVLMSLSKDEAERMRLMSEHKNKLDLQSEISWARKKARAEGKAEGQLEERQRIQKLLAQGLSIDEIMKNC